MHLPYRFILHIFVLVFFPPESNVVAVGHRGPRRLRPDSKALLREHQLLRRLLLRHRHDQLQQRPEQMDRGVEGQPAHRENPSRRNEGRPQGEPGQHQRQRWRQR